MSIDAMVKLSEESSRSPLHGVSQGRHHDRVVGWEDSSGLGAQQESEALFVLRDVDLRPWEQYLGHLR